MKTQFETWWEEECKYGSNEMRELCRTAWENGAYCALNPVITTSGYVQMEDLPRPRIDPGPNDWHDTPPERPGTYDFCCGETDYEIESVVVVNRKGELWATIGGEYRPVSMWHEGLTYPAWRTPEPQITTEDDDLNEPLGQACVLGDTNCESCS